MHVHWLRRNTLAVILLLSLCVHLAVAIISRHGVIKDDAESYVLIGTNLAQGKGYVFQPGGEPTSWRGPGYPIMLAAIFKLTNGSYQAVRFVQAFLWVGVALCVWKITVILFGPDAALVAVVLAGFYPEFLGFTGLLWSESLFTFLFSVSLLCLVNLVSFPRTSVAVALGIFLGTSILTRSAAVTLVGTIVLACLVGKISRSRGAIAILIAALIVAPWTLRNYQVHRHFMPVESNSTMNLFAGTRPYTPIIFGWRSLKYLPNDPEYRSVIQLKTEGQQYEAFGKLAAHSVRAHPLRYTLMVITKTFDFWLPDFFISRQIAAGVFGAALRPFWIPWEIVTAASFLLILYGAIASAIASCNRWGIRILVCAIVLFTLPHSLVFGVSRYHVPLMPILMVLAAPKIRELICSWRSLLAGKCGRFDGIRLLPEDE